jgi:processing peptidase subunit beta
MAAGIWQVFQVPAAAGALRHDELVRTTQESFKNLSTNPITAGKLVEKEPAFFTGSEVRQYGQASVL